MAIGALKNGAIMAAAQWRNNHGVMAKSKKENGINGESYRQLSAAASSI
jgi:hypothetical protein